MFRVAVVVWVLWLGQSLFGEVAWVPTFEQAKRLAREENKLIVLDVSADWCPPCQEMARNVHPDPEFQEFTTTQVFMLVDAYKDAEGVKLARKFDVKFFPTILVLTTEGKEIERFTGGRTSKGLIEALQLIFDHPISFNELNRRADELEDDYETQKLAGERARRYLGRAVELAPDDDLVERAGLLVSHARVSLEDGHPEATLESLARLESISPGRLEFDSVRILRARGLIALKRHEEAMQDLRELVRSGSERDEARKLLTRVPKRFRKDDQELQQALERGEKLVNKEKAGEALVYAERAVDLAPDSPQAHLLLARVHAKLREESTQQTEKNLHFSATVRHFLFARRLEPDDPEYWLVGKQILRVPTVQIEPRQPKVAKVYAKAENFFAKGQYYEAAKLYLKVMEAEPEFSRAYLHMGDCHFENNNFTQALLAYRAAAQLAPLDASTHRFAADALFRLGRTEEARQSLMASLLADPEYPLIWRDLKRTSNQGFERHLYVIPMDLMLAQSAHYSNLLENLEPKTAPAWQAYLDMKLRWQERIFPEEFPGEPHRHTAREELACLTGLAEKWGEMRMEDPLLEDPELEFLCQLFLDDQLDTFIFLELFSELLRPEFETWKQQNAGKIEPYLKDYVYGSALAGLREGYNSSAILAYNTGVGLHSSAPEQAIEQYERALAYEPYEEPALDNLSLLYLQREEYESAEKLLLRWLRKDPDSARALDRLALIHFDTGRLESAVDLVEKALQLSEDPEDRQRLETNLEIFRRRLSLNSDSE